MSFPSVLIAKSQQLDTHTYCTLTFYFIFTFTLLLHHSLDILQSTFQIISAWIAFVYTYQQFLYVLPPLFTFDSIRYSHCRLCLLLLSFFIFFTLFINFSVSYSVHDIILPHFLLSYRLFRLLFLFFLLRLNALFLVFSSFLSWFFLQSRVFWLRLSPMEELITRNV